MRSGSTSNISPVAQNMDLVRVCWFFFPPDFTAGRRKMWAMIWKNNTGVHLFLLSYTEMLLNLTHWRAERLASLTTALIQVVFLNALKMYFSWFFFYAARRGQNHVYLLACARQIFIVYTHHHHHHHRYSASEPYSAMHVYITPTFLCLFALWDNKLWTCGFTVDQDQKIKRHFEEERHDSRDKMWLSDVLRLQLYIINL